MYDEYLDYLDPTKIQSFQDSPGSNYFNGINFISIVPEDFDDLGASATDYSFSFVMWDKYKIFTPHPLTSGEVDPTRGNRLAGCPIAQKRVGVVEQCLTQVGHQYLADVIYQSYDSGSEQVTMRFKTPVAADLIALGERFVLARSISQDSVFTGLGSVDYDVSSLVEEWSGSIVSSDGITVVVQLDSTPANAGNLSDIKYIAPDNQSMWILPLGQVTSGADSYSGEPSNIGIASWTYFDTSANAIGPFTCITPKIKTTYASIDDLFKYFIIIERKPGFQAYNNGFKLMPISIVY
jgi:hypothetical protein